ncbi:MAG: hypothetical protein VYD19_07620 [Myxococcota bacterium]|nr:hypothetical protein [Myxococcota bacterium]
MRLLTPLLTISLALLTPTLFIIALFSWGKSPPLVSLLLFGAAYNGGRACLARWGGSDGL